MTDTANITPEEFASAIEEVRREVGRVIVGQAQLVDTVMIGALCEGHVLLEGVPGLGKTKLLATLGQVLSVEFGRIQFTPDLMPADILGTNVLQGDDFVFHQGPVFANLVLADEINRATPKTQSALLEAMQERSVTLGGESHRLPRPFLVMATQNPIEQEGTYPLPEAQLDRFLFKALVEFPPATDLVEILRRTTAGSEAVPTSVLDGPTLQRMSALVRSLPAGRHLLRYAATLVEATHPSSPISPETVRTYVRNGASPRGAQALVLGGKARALMDGRPNVAAEDLWALAPMALRHRLVLGYDALADGVTADDIIRAVVEAHPEPVEEPEGSTQPAKASEVAAT
ncbi:MAG TPA: AAA family ATPase [Acidimicrobiia bacterium]|nr:AAA family ATPase [Acidimicrobiia bacterium]